MGVRREAQPEVVVVEVLQTYRGGWPVVEQTTMQALLISVGHPYQAGPSLGRAPVLPPPQGRALLF